jgi:hypothetical protein
MKSADLFTELTAIYRKHGWELRNALLRPETHVELQSQLPNDLPVKEATVDALWFSRPSYNNREAWEYDVKLEMEARLRDYLTADSRG